MIQGVLLDIGGVIAVGQALLPGALTALDRLRRAGLPVRLITNTTRQSRHALQTQLDSWNLGTAPDALFTPATAARAYLLAHGLEPHLLVHPRLEPEFDGLPTGGPMAVVVGDAGDAFTYGALNACLPAACRRRRVPGTGPQPDVHRAGRSQPGRRAVRRGPGICLRAAAPACSASPLPPSSWKHSTAWGCPRPRSL